MKNLLIYIGMGMIVVLAIPVSVILFLGFVYYVFLMPAMMFIYVVLGGMLLSEFITKYIFPF